MSEIKPSIDREHALGRKVKALEAENNCLRKIIEDAPHGGGCQTAGYSYIKVKTGEYGYRPYPEGTCDCWKSEFDK